MTGGGEGEMGNIVISYVKILYFYPLLPLLEYLPNMTISNYSSLTHKKVIFYIF